MNEVLHRCPNCSNIVISARAIEHCDKCRTSEAVYQMTLEGRVFMTTSPLATLQKKETS